MLNKKRCSYKLIIEMHISQDVWMPANIEKILFIMLDKLPQDSTLIQNFVKYPSIELHFFHTRISQI